MKHAPGACSTGFTFITPPNSTRISGPITSVLAVETTP